jgi:uncharacterized PurR-regulated membrane protein YhhQ (DUF165 family)
MKPIITKLAWIAFALAGAPFVYFVAPGKGEWIHAAAVLAVGLAMFFFASESNNDERVAELKLKAVKLSFVPALGVTLLINMVVLNPDEPDLVSHSLSAFDFAGLVMLASMVLFHFWRWEDGRATRPE